MGFQNAIDRLLAEDSGLENKRLGLEAVPKLQFWNSNLKIRSFARLKA